MDINDLLFFIAPLFFIISFIYSGAGFGGGSSYIAILVLFGASLYNISPISLALNIVVSSIAFYNYLKAGYFLKRFSIPLLSSIPFAFLSGTVILEESVLTVIFISTLFCASFALLFSGTKIKKRYNKVQDIKITPTKIVLITLPLGAILGTISGLVGIGGGIWLSPILILSGLVSSKEASAAASLFILTNSVSSLIGRLTIVQIDYNFILPLSLIVLIGGFLGSRWGAFKLKHERLNILVGILVAVAGLNLTFRHLQS